MNSNCINEECKRKDTCVRVNHNATSTQPVISPLTPETCSLYVEANSVENF